MPGFDHVLHSVLDAFANRREQVTSQSQQITNWLNQSETKSEDFEFDQQLLIEAVKSLHRNFDFQHGGFGSAPKFPHAMDLSLLIRVAENWSSELTPNIDQILEMLKINLKKMAYGGIFDHLAGGFARYSVDEFWLVPHFEKMLYDNALLAGVYLDMYSATGDKFYSMIAGKTLDYLLNYMRDSAGGFHSTEDADSEGVEGKFYVWSKAETLDVLGEESGNRFCELYNVTEQGNFEGSNILNMTKSYQEFADAYSIDKEELRTEMQNARKALLGIRDQRVRPAKDDKLLVSWNALAIASFARAAVQLNNRTYEDAAISAAEFVLENMKKDDGGLLHTWRSGNGKLDAFLDDYSYLLVAFLERQCVSLIVLSPSIQAVEDLKSVLAGKSCVDGQTALYICSGFSCAEAMVGLENVEAAITGLASTN